MSVKKTKALTIAMILFLIPEIGYAVTVYDFFASWCGPCRADIQRDNELQAYYGSKVKFIGVNEDVDDGAANAFIASTKPTFEIRKDPTHEFAKSMGAANATPTTVIVGNNGEKEVINGSLSKEALKSKIDTYLTK